MFASVSEAQLNLKTAMQRPLIIGASVSADFGTLSPGKRLALRFTKESEIQTSARSGTPGVETLKRLSEGSFKDRTAVLALDLFFWDSVQADPVASIASMKRLVDETQRLGIPLVLGEIPDLLWGRQVSRVQLNDAIKSHSLIAKECYVMPFDHMHRQIMQRGFIAARGQQLTIRQIVPDGLHLSDLASEFLADRLEDLLLL